MAYMSDHLIGLSAVTGQAVGVWLQQYAEEISRLYMNSSVTIETCFGGYTSVRTHPAPVGAKDRIDTLYNHVCDVSATSRDAVDVAMLPVLSGAPPFSDDSIASIIIQSLPSVAAYGRTMSRHDTIRSAMDGFGFTVPTSTIPHLHKGTWGAKATLLSQTLNIPIMIMEAYPAYKLCYPDARSRSLVSASTALPLLRRLSSIKVDATVYTPVAAEDDPRYASVHALHRRMSTNGRPPPCLVIVHPHIDIHTKLQTTSSARNTRHMALPHNDTISHGKEDPVTIFALHVSPHVQPHVNIEK